MLALPRNDILENRHPPYISIVSYLYFTYSLVPQGGLVCEEGPLVLNAFLSIRPPKGLKNIRYLRQINKSEKTRFPLAILTSTYNRFENDR